MSIEEALSLVPGKLIIHREQVFFNTRDPEVAREWKRMGATIRPWYEQDELDRRRADPERPDFTPGYEIHLLPMVTLLLVTEEEDALTATREELLRQAREMTHAAA